MEYLENPPTRPISKLRDIDFLYPDRRRLMGYLSLITNEHQRQLTKQYALNLLLYVARLKGGDPHWMAVELSIHELIDEVYRRSPIELKVRRVQIIDMIMNGPGPENELYELSPTPPRSTRSSLSSPTPSQRWLF
ncbi:hypothetical protein FRC18_005802 [Serendipita sp. 400]|nr:hypothetical protein FRC18_005802 [Serendipita sp. 400]